MDRTIVNSSSCKKRKLKQTFRVLFRGWLAGQLEKRFPTDKTISWSHPVTSEIFENSLFNKFLKEWTGHSGQRSRENPSWNHFILKLFCTFKKVCIYFGDRVYFSCPS